MANHGGPTSCAVFSSCDVKIRGKTIKESKTRGRHLVPACYDVIIEYTPAPHHNVILNICVIICILISAHGAVWTLRVVLQTYLGGYDMLLWPALVIACL